MIATSYQECVATCTHTGCIAGPLYNANIASAVHTGSTVRCSTWYDFGAATAEYMVGISYTVERSHARAGRPLLNAS